MKTLFLGAVVFFVVIFVMADSKPTPERSPLACYEPIN